METRGNRTGSWKRSSYRVRGPAIKYIACEYVMEKGRRIRKLSETEIAELQAHINAVRKP